MKVYPLVFTYRDPIVGNGFVADVQISGRVLLEECEEDTWLYGVQPGTIAGGHPNRDVAFLEFKKAYLSVIFDIAAEATSFKIFKDMVTNFFSQVNEPNESDWKDAVEEVRRNKVTLPDLKRVDSDAIKPLIKIEEIVAKRPAAGPPSTRAATTLPDSSMNEFDQRALAA